jgi:hypothetical protein
MVLFLPLAIGWWVLSALGIIVVWFFRNSRRLRSWLVGDLKPEDLGQ